MGGSALSLSHFYQRKVCFALRRRAVVFLPITIIPIMDEGLHVVVFSVTIFGEVDALIEGVILLHHVVAICTDASSHSCSSVSERTLAPHTGSTA